MRYNPRKTVAEVAREMEGLSKSLRIPVSRSMGDA